MAGDVQDRGTFAGIARTLLALALLAERSAGRSLPVRFLVLVLFGRAEAIARRFVAHEIEPCGFSLDLTQFDVPSGLRFGAAGAELLALRLRMLAAILGALADADAAAAGLSDGHSAGWAADDRTYGFHNVSPRAGVANNLPLLLIVRFPPARRRPPDTS